jgi:hypothetical protein
MPAQSDAARRPGQPWIKDRGALAGVIRELLWSGCSTHSAHALHQAVLPIFGDCVRSPRVAASSGFAGRRAQDTRAVRPAHKAGLRQGRFPR